ncbi:glycosyltransferase [Anditalea andensis]|uniref:Glycosyl transferase family 2 n=1 Tax=Anditalea andensis TaxID=1048983 RepID=A0A074KYV7_9BACT|nr:glycosyltransferase [Anditalea andensis]KEO74094.1 glycosyl transferase family 2 [Anditalea andensis]
MILIYPFIAVYVMAMLFVFFYSLAQAHLLFIFLKKKKNLSPIVIADIEALPYVTVQLPLFNEKYVVDRLIHAAAAIRYPAAKLEIQLLDDSTDETVQMVQSCIRLYPQFDIVHIQRDDRKGFKAGALKNALGSAKGELIAIFDADFVPDPDFLIKTVGFFKDPKVGMVQSRWTHLNEDYSILTRLQAFALDAHFMVEQLGRNCQKAFINFNGTGGIWRKACILDAGNWEDDTLTEDLDLSYRAQKKGWEFIYRPDIASPAELPPVMSAIKSQQFRWTKGGAECAVKHLKSVFTLPLPWKTKYHATAHLLNSFIFIAVLVASISSIPIWWAFYDNWIPEYYFQAAAVFLLSFIVIALVYFFANLSLLKFRFKGTLQFLYELPLFLSVSMGLSLHNSQAVWEGLTGRKSPFIRTPKYNLKQGKNSWQKNVYHQINIPLTTYGEGLLMIIFSCMVILSIYTATYEMIIFHLMLAIGYGTVAITSLRSYRTGSI